MGRAGKIGNAEDAMDLLSMVMFQPNYLSRLIELGESDTEAFLR